MSYSIKGVIMAFETSPRILPMSVMLCLDNRGKQVESSMPAFLATSEVSIICQQTLTHVAERITKKE